MISLETLSALLSVGEAELIEELVLALLASPQLAIFFEKFPGLKQAMLRDVPRWKAEINASLKRRRYQKRWATSFSCFSAPSCSAITTLTSSCLKYLRR